MSIIYELLKKIKARPQKEEERNKISANTKPAGKGKERIALHAKGAQ